MKKTLFTITLFFLFSSTFHGKELKEKKDDSFFSNKLGLSFQIQGLNSLVENDNNGIISGVGLRYWIFDRWMLRSIVFCNYRSFTVSNGNTVSNINEVRVGLSLGGEFHFVKEMVSPYLGGLFGFESSSVPPPGGIDWHICGLFGVEFALHKYFSLFVEYSLIMTFRQLEFELDLGYNHLPVLGFIVYFN